MIERSSYFNHYNYYNQNPVNHLNPKIVLSSFSLEIEFKVHAA